MPKTKTGIIEATCTGNLAQRVKCDDGEIIFFNGISTIKDAKVGDRVTMTYRTLSTFGLWFATVDKS